MNHLLGRAGAAIVATLSLGGVLMPRTIQITTPPDPPVPAIIQKLIQCESGGVNITRPDSDGILSDGILQYHRGPDDKIDDGTWAAFSEKSGIKGSPLIPADAIKMAEWAIANGYGPRWTCWHILHLTAPTGTIDND